MSEKINIPEKRIEKVLKKICTTKKLDKIIEKMKSMKPLEPWEINDIVLCRELQRDFYNYLKIPVLEEPTVIIEDSTKNVYYEGNREFLINFLKDRDLEDKAREVENWPRYSIYTNKVSILALKIDFQLCGSFDFIYSSYKTLKEIIKSSYCNWYKSELHDEEIGKKISNFLKSNELYIFEKVFPLNTEDLNLDFEYRIPELALIHKGINPIEGLNRQFNNFNPKIRSLDFITIKINRIVKKGGLKVSYVKEYTYSPCKFIETPGYVPKIKLKDYIDFVDKDSTFRKTRLYKRSPDFIGSIDNSTIKLIFPWYKRSFFMRKLIRSAKNRIVEKIICILAGCFITKLIEILFKR